MIDISVGIDLFNNCDFFSAHDFFEDIWMDSVSNEKLFFQGLVQISVGSYHLICGNLKGAKSQYSKGINKLRDFEPVFYNIDLTLLNNKIEVLLNNLIINKYTFSSMPKIELINKNY